MAASNYDEALDRLLKDEGGYTNHPSDPGGPTNFGITIHDYRRYVKSDATAADVRAMTLTEAKNIYRAKYWDALRCDDLPSGVDYAVFDYGVNSGIYRSAKVLQRVVGALVDGIIGDGTLEMTAQRDPATVVNAICDERMHFLKRLRTWPVFGKGWSKRVRGVRARSLELAKTAAPGGKALGDDIPLATDTAKPMHKSKIGITQIAAGGSGAGIALTQMNDYAAKLGRAKDQAQHLGLIDVLSNVAHSPLFWLGIVVILCAAAAFYWRWKDYGRGAR